MSLGDAFLLGVLLTLIDDEGLDLALRTCDRAQSPGASEGRYSVLQEIEFRRTTRANVLATVALADDPED